MSLVTCLHSQIANFVPIVSFLPFLTTGIVGISRPTTIETVSAK
jgi:hypothetical protein